MFDLEKLEVRHGGNGYGLAVPQVITRHTHPKARPEIVDRQRAEPIGIDYLHRSRYRPQYRTGFASRVESR